MTVKSGRLAAESNEAFGGRHERSSPAIGLVQHYQERVMDKDSTLPDDFDHYEYHRYISGGEKPDVGIRDLIDKNGRRMGSQTIDPETGEPLISSGWVSGIRNGPYFEECTKEEFDRINAERMAWVKRQKQQAPETGTGPA